MEPKDIVPFGFASLAALSVPLAIIGTVPSASRIATTVLGTRLAYVPCTPILFLLLQSPPVDSGRCHSPTFSSLLRHRNRDVMESSVGKQTMGLNGSI